jgi:hypothetical protein
MCASPRRKKEVVDSVCCAVLYINLKSCLIKRLLLRYGSPLSKEREVWA